MGGSATYSVDLEELDLLVAEMTACERGLEDLAADVEREMTALRQVWTGLASEAQREAHEEWAQGMAEMRHALGRLRVAARTAHDNYTAAIEANLRMWERLR